MTSRSDRTGGFSLLEALTVLAILSLVLAAFAGRFQRAEEGRAVMDQANQLIDAAALARLTALNDGAPVRLQPASSDGVSIDDCDGGTPAPLLFLPDGGANEARLCLSDGTHRIALHLDWLTGQLKAGSE